MDKGAWWATVHGVTSQPRVLSKGCNARALGVVQKPSSSNPAAVSRKARPAHHGWPPGTRGTSLLLTRALCACHTRESQVCSHLGPLTLPTPPLGRCSPSLPFPLTLQDLAQRPPPPRSPPSATLHSSYCSVAKSCPTLCDPMDCSTPGFPVRHCRPASARAHTP